MSVRHSPPRSEEPNSTFVIEPDRSPEPPKDSPDSPGSALSQSLRFLEASHLLSDEEMLSMGCQPPARSEPTIPSPEAAPVTPGTPSLLSDSVLNASFGGLLTSTCEKPKVRPPDIAESPICFDPDLDNCSEPDNATYSLKSHEPDSAPDKSLEACSLHSEQDEEPPLPPAEMDVLDKLSEHSHSEPDLTMREEAAAAVEEESSALKKKRTRSPTPSSVKTESIPAKRSLTQRPRGAARSSVSAPLRRASATATTARPSTASSTSLADKPARRSVAVPAPKKGPELPASARRASLPPNRAAKPEPEAKKAPARTASTLSRPTTASARREKPTEAGPAAGSRLKAPSLLQRTFSRKGSARPASPASTPRPTGTRASVTSLTSQARQKDSQLQPKASKTGRPSSASDRPSVSSDRSSTASGRPSTASERASASTAKSQPDGRMRPPPKTRPRSALSSNSSDVKSSSNRKPAGCSSPDPELRAQIATQAGQLADKEACLAEIRQRCAAKEQALATCRSRLQDAARAFSAMAIVSRTLDHRAGRAERAELKLREQLREVIEQTKEVAAQCESLIREKEALKAEVEREAKAHRAKLAEVNASHKAALQSERERLAKEQDAEVARVIDQHSAEVKTLKQFHDKELDRSRMRLEAEMEEMRSSHTADLEEISRRDEKHLEELQNQHEKRIAEITQRFEEMKVTLSNRIQVLHMECNDLRSKSFEEHEFVRRNSDVKLQAAIQQFQHLPEENASLKAVLDLRINENAELRRQNSELEAKISDLQEIRVKNDQLLRQNENLEAIIILKSDNEKQLQERHQSLLRRFDRESKEKKRLSMNYEEVLYKLEECQSSDDFTKRSLSDIPSMTSSAVVMRASNATSRPRPRGLQHDRSKRKTIASSRELD